MTFCGCNLFRKHKDREKKKELEGYSCRMYIIGTLYPSINDEPSTVFEPRLVTYYNQSCHDDTKNQVVTVINNSRSKITIATMK